MATANETLLNESVAHAIDLQGYSNSTVKRIIRLLNSVDADLQAQLIKALNKMPPSEFNVARLEKLLKSVRELNEKAYLQVYGELQTELKNLTDYELGYQEQLFGSVLADQIAFSKVNVNQAYAAAMARPFQGRLLKEWMTGLEATRAAKIRDAIRIGYVEGETTDQIVRRIIGTKSLQYTDGIMEASRRDMQAIVRTAISHTANYANTAFTEANADIVKGYLYHATLDMRTTTICASRDGNVYPLGKARPAIPAHFNCRSRYVQVLKTWREMGIDADEISPSTRASLDGQVPETMTYQTWLEKQSIERQNEVLGVTKAKLFREGNLPLERFVSKQGHEYTLAELRARDKEAFAKAGL